MMENSGKRERYETLKDLCTSEGNLKYLLICFGDFLAEREKYREHRGIDAVHFYLIQKYGWLPSQVRSMSDDDLNFVLLEEMQAWTLPKEAVC